MTHSEWDMDLDRMSVDWKRDEECSWDLATKGRCRKCWGPVTARGDSEQGCTAIQCQVCGAVVRGRAACEEMERMEAERAANLLGLDLGAVSSGSAGRFTFKVFPDVGRLSKAEVTSQVASQAQRNPRKWITRADFPVGSAGWLIFQARALLAGIEHRTIWDERSFVGFTKFDTRDDGSLFVPDGPASNAEGSQRKESRVLRWMGLTMAATMQSAFACELTLKAIALTCKDEAKKVHDLFVLLEDLPDTSRSRMQADFPEIASLFDRKRHTFGAWRYFERDAGDGGVKALVDIAAARDLGRAARVLLDEAAVVGLRAGFEFDGIRNTVDTDSDSLHRDHFRIRLTGGESPPAQ